MIKILVTGDFSPTERVLPYISQKRYASLFSEVKSIAESADYAIVNFESTIKCDGKPIDKAGPNLSCPIESVDALRWMGIKCVTLANNHLRDYGEQGVLSTLNAFNDYSIDYVGAGRNTDDASRVLYKTINGERVAIINCCEHEFSIAGKCMAGCNPLNPIHQFYDITKAKKTADYVIVIVHGGHEFYRLPSVRMLETYRFFVDAGADVVINHHQHCCVGYEVYKNHPIFYGLGNFCFDSLPIHHNVSEDWYYGYMVYLSLRDGNVDYKIIPYQQNRGEVGVKLLEPTAFDKDFERLNTIISSPEKLKKCQEEYYDKCARNMAINIFEPTRSRLLLKAIRRGLLPSMLSRKRRNKTKNYILCESHRDKIIHYLSDKL